MPGKRCIYARVIRENLGLYGNNGKLKALVDWLFSCSGSIINNTGYSRDPIAVWLDRIRLWVIGLCKVYSWQNSMHVVEKKFV